MLKSPSGLVPVRTVAGGNCLFRAAITACAANVVGQCDINYDLLQEKIAEELAANARWYGKEMERHTAIAAQSPDCRFTQIALFSSCLSERGIATLERTLRDPSGGGTAVAFQNSKAVEAESEATRANGCYALLYHLCVIANILKVRINSVYPEVNKGLRPLLHTTVEPLDCPTRAEITIMWSSTVKASKNVTFVRLNHCLPLLSAGTFTKGPPLAS